MTVRLSTFIGLNFWVRCCLAAQLLLTLAGSVCAVLDYRVIRNYEQGVYLSQVQALADEAVNQARLIDLRNAQILLLAASAVLMLSWLHDASFKARRVHATAMGFSPSLAVASFFIPLAHLWLPAQVLKNLWAVRLGIPRPLEMPRLLRYWQALWRLSLLFTYLYLVVDAPDNFVWAKVADWIAVGLNLCVALLALTSLEIVKRIDRVPRGWH